MGTFDRSAGILMPISSLASPYGIGTLGKAAYEFVDFVKACRHSYWQVLPLGPTSFGDSPYQGFSAFAGNPYFVDLEMLIEEGLLDRNYVNRFDWGNDEACVAYDKIYHARFTVLREAYNNFKEKSDPAFDDFKEENGFWLGDYALFMACKQYFHGADWGNWDEDIRFRKPQAVAKYEKELAEDIEFYEFIQYKFFEQWKRLKKYANENGVEIIGDIPIYMAYDSADVWVNAKQFLLDDECRPTLVAGVPPDAFTELGQKWGNPIYDWEKMESDGFIWWKKRMKAMAELCDVIRIDHFLGIVKYYTIPAEDPDARKGKYFDGPGKKLTEAFNSVIGGTKIIAEDLGVSIPEATNLLAVNGYPGMKVLEFAFGGDRKNEHLPHNYKTNNLVVYGGTHDNETLMGYFCGCNDWELGYAFDYLDTRNREKMVDQVFRVAYGSIADLVIFQVQDILKLGNEARMNFPSTQEGNWQWRLKKGQLGQRQIDDMRYLASVFGREAK